MGEYRRFVSYLYEDNGAEKGKNAGFVRVEVRGPQVSFRIGLKDARGVGQAVLMSAGRELVELGKLRLTEERESEKLTANRENVQASGLSFEDFSGLRIELPDPKRRYQTFWDTRVSPQTKFAWRGEAVKTILPEEPQKQDVRTILPEEPQKQDVKIILSEEQQMEEVEEILPEESQQEAERIVLPEEPRREEMKTILPDELRQKGLEEFSGEADLSEDDQKMTSDELPVSAAEEVLPKELLPKELSEETKAQSISCTELWREEPRITWPQLQNIYPKLLPFGKYDSWQVLRIHLQDIGRLPREYWILGNNDFVVHGYEAYHHLLLIHDPAGDITYLGVPGEELPQERRAAELFGFRRYRRAEPVGYWLIRIKL